MRSAKASLSGVVVALLSLSASPSSDALAVVHRQRYSMGTMFDIVVHHVSRGDAERAVERAMAEILRLDDVLSHYKTESDLSRLNREGGAAAVKVDPSLHDVVRTSIAFAQRSRGRFDITIAPLLNTWKAAAEEGRRPSASELVRARQCVGYEKIEVIGTDRVRFRSDCVEIDLGGIGKGYAVDRALAILKAAGIRHAMINAGGSSIAAIGAPPGRKGWPVVVGRSVLVLDGASVSTSQQDPAGDFAGVVDPFRGVPPANRIAVSVVAPSATVADALSTTLVMLPVEQAPELLAQFDDVSVLWIGIAGDVRAAYRESRLELTGGR